MSRKYYKVVSIGYNNKLYSAVSHTHNMLEFDVEYEVDKWVTPRQDGTKLFMFNSRKEAYSWAMNHTSWMPNGYKIYEVEVKNPRNIKIIQTYITMNAFREFWKRRNNKKKIITYSKTGPPSSTMICDAIKLTKLKLTISPIHIDSISRNMCI